MIPERIVWAVDALGLKPKHQVLEIGCGVGAALSLICEQVPKGKVVGLDRSKTAIARARARNAGPMRSGLLELRTGALQRASLEAGRFDRVFSFNVGEFWLRPDAVVPRVRDCLSEKGLAFFFYQAPGRRDSAALSHALTNALVKHGFRQMKPRLPAEPDGVLCVVARRR